MVGKALKELPRERVQLAARFGIIRPDGMQFSVNGTPEYEYVRGCCEASLKRLDVSYIDLCYQHRIDISVPIEDTVNMDILSKEGEKDQRKNVEKAGGHLRKIAENWF